MSARLFDDVPMPDNTRRIYQSRFVLFEAWCSERGIDSIPASPEVIQEYLVTLAGEKKSVSTISLSRAAIVKAHVLRGHAPPVSERLHGTMRDLRRRALRRGSIPVAKLETIVAACVGDALGARDRALLLVTYHGDLGRTEAIGLDRGAVQRDPFGYVVSVASRNNKRALVRLTARPDSSLCPVAALDAWIAQRDARMDKTGPLFVALRPRNHHRDVHVGQRLSPEDVDRILKRRALDAGIDPTTVTTRDLRASREAVIMTRPCHDNCADNTNHTQPTSW